MKKKSAIKFCTTEVSGEHRGYFVDSPFIALPGRRTAAFFPIGVPLEDPWGGFRDALQLKPEDFFIKVLKEFCKLHKVHIIISAHEECTNVHTCKDSVPIADFIKAFQESDESTFLVQDIILVLTASKCFLEEAPSLHDDIED